MKLRQVVGGAVGLLVIAGVPQVIAWARRSAAVLVDPATGLRPGQSVTVRGAGFAPNSFVFVGICAPGSSALIADSDEATSMLVSTDTSGDFSARMIVRPLEQSVTAQATDAGAADGDCVIGAGSNPRGGPEATAPLAFAATVLRTAREPATDSVPATHLI